MNDSPPPPPADRPPGYPAGLERVWQTADGAEIRLRPLRPDDIEREIAFVAGLSEETRYQRLQYSSHEVTREDALRMLDLDYRDRMAVGAFVGDGPGSTLIGVSRYARVGDSDQGECAIVVTDAWHGRGVGTELMRSLAQAARANGIRALVGSSLAENQRIQNWARRFGFDVRTEPYSGGAARITVDLGTLPA